MSDDGISSILSSMNLSYLMATSEASAAVPQRRTRVCPSESYNVVRFCACVCLGPRASASVGCAVIYRFVACVFMSHVSRDLEECSRAYMRVCVFFGRRATAPRRRATPVPQASVCADGRVHVWCVLFVRVSLRPCGRAAHRVDDACVLPPTMPNYLCPCVWRSARLRNGVTCHGAVPPRGECACFPRATTSCCSTTPGSVWFCVVPPEHYVHICRASSDAAAAPRGEGARLLRLLLHCVRRLLSYFLPQSVLQLDGRGGMRVISVAEIMRERTGAISAAAAHGAVSFATAGWWRGMQIL
jgi:hypothetical protein